MPRLVSRREVAKREAGALIEKLKEEGYRCSYDAGRGLYVCAKEPNVIEIKVKEEAEEGHA